MLCNSIDNTTGYNVCLNAINKVIKLKIERGIAIELDILVKSETNYILQFYDLLYSNIKLQET